MLKVKVFSDFACPFCYLGAALLDRLKEDGIEYEVEWIPFELDPNAPLEGMDLFQIYPEEYVTRSLDMLSRMGKEYGLEYNNKNGKFNTHRAHLGGFYAKEKGLYDKYLKAMFKAYFTDGSNLGDKKVLNKLAEDIGLNPEEMNNSIDSGKYNESYRRAKEETERYKIQSVPTFIIDDRAKISGIREYSKFKEEFIELSKE